MSIQGSINSIIGSVSKGVIGLKGVEAIKGKSIESPQSKAAKLAKENSDNEKKFRTQQQEQFKGFMQKLANTPANVQTAFLNKIKED